MTEGNAVVAYTNGAWNDLIDEFMLYTDKRISPEMFKLWAGISLVGGACERRVWVRSGDNISYPSFYIFLVAPPGVGKSIINDVKELWAETEEPSGGPAFHIASDNVTRASLVDELNEAEQTRFVNGGASFIYHCLLLPAEEFEEFLPSYDPSTISLLNSVWNNKASLKESRRHGPATRIDIKNPCLNIIGGVQPAYFVTHFPEEAWNTGLIRRTVMVYADTTPLRSPFESTPGRDAIKQHILSRLGHISTLYGEARWADNTPEMLTEWHMAGGPPIPSHSRLKYYITGRTQSVMKLALISAVARTGALIIEEPDLKRAMVWLLEAEKKMPDIFRAMTGKSDSQILEELYFFVNTSWLKDKKGVRSTLVQHFLANRVTSEKIAPILMTAEKSGMLVKSTDNTDLWLPRPKHLHGVE